MRKYFGFLLVLGLVVLSSCSLFSPEQSTLPEVKDEGAMKKHLASNKLAVVDFFGTFCGPCRALLPIITEVDKEQDDVKVFTVNVDDLQKWTNKYDVHGIPTLIYFKDGKELFRTVGFQSKSAIETKLREMRK